MGSKFTIKQVMNMTGCNRQMIFHWINTKALKAERRGNSWNSAWMVDETDLRNFMLSDKYSGNPADILSSRPFNRVPDMEICYPINLAAQVIGIRIDGETDDMPYDIWQIDMSKLRELVTHLTDKEQKLIEMRYHLGMTLDECGVAMNLTRERIRQIIIKALRKLRNELHYGNCLVVSATKYSDAMKQIELLTKKIAELEKLLPNTESENHIAKANEFEKQKMETPIEELNLSTRAYNCLARAFKTHTLCEITVGKLVAFDQNQHVSELSAGKVYYGQTWYNIRNLGRKTLREIATKLFKYCGYRIRYFDTDTEQYISPVELLEGNE